MDSMIRKSNVSFAMLGLWIAFDDAISSYILSLMVHIEHFCIEVNIIPVDTNRFAQTKTSIKNEVYNSLIFKRFFL